MTTLLQSAENRDGDIIRETAVLRLAAPEMMERTEHALIPFSAFREPNPRAMKRVVNTYSAYRAFTILSGVHLSRHQLARSIILSIRRPGSAAYLREEPEKIDLVGKPDLGSGDSLTDG